MSARTRARGRQAGAADEPRAFRSCSAGELRGPAEGPIGELARRRGAPRAFCAARPSSVSHARVICSFARGLSSAVLARAAHFVGDQLLPWYNTGPVKM